MLVRFRQDVVSLKPSSVVILAGTNDIAENTGPISLENTFGNIVSIVEIEKVNYIKPYSDNPGIRRLNLWIKYANI